MTDVIVRKMFARAGQLAGFGFRVNPHMLRHACGYNLANDGVDTRMLQAYLGHTNIQSTVLYTKLAADRFNGLWRDWQVGASAPIAATMAFLTMA